MIGGPIITLLLVCLISRLMYFVVMESDFRPILACLLLLVKRISSREAEIRTLIAASEPDLTKLD